MARIRRMLAAWNNNWRIYDAAAAGTFLLIGGWYVWRYQSLATVAQFLNETRAGMYSTLAGVAGGLLGFVITGVSILLTFGDSPRLQQLRQTARFKEVFLVFTASWRWLGLTTILSLVGNLVDRDKSPHLWFTMIILVGVVMSAVRLGRSLWVLENMIDIAVLDQQLSKQPAAAPVPELLNNAADSETVNAP